MNELTLKVLLGEVLRETSRESSAQVAVCERAFEERLPAMLQARDTAAEVSLTETATEAIVARLQQAVSDRTEAPRLKRTFRLPFEHRNGQHQPPTRPSRRGLVFAVGAIVVLVAIGLWLAAPWQQQRFLATPKQGPVKESPTPGLPRKETPPPKTQAPRSEGPVVRGQQDPKKSERGRNLLVERPAPAGKFGSVSGEPLVFDAVGGKPVKATRDMVVAIGSRIETGDMDRAEILLADGSVLRLGFNTVVSIPSGAGGQLLTARDFALTSGSIVAKVATTPDGRRFTVQTPVATAEVLGTEFSLGLEKVRQGTTLGPKLKAVLQVKSGRVAFFNNFDRVEAGSMTESTAMDGSAPTEPKRIRTLLTYTIYLIDFPRHVQETTERLSERGAEVRYVHPRTFSGLLLQTRSGAVRVTEVGHDSPAETAGIRVGDLVLAINNASIADSVAAQKVIAQAPGKTFKLSIEREGERLSVSLRTRLDDRLPRNLSPSFAARLYQATRPALSGESESALRKLQILARTEPQGAAFNNLGVIYETKDELGHAIRSYREAVRLDPGTALYRYNLGLALRKIGNFARSSEELERAVELDPSSHDWTVPLASAYCHLGRFDDAIDVVLSALNRWPRCPDLWIGLSSVHIRAQRPQDAIQAAEKAVEVSPANARAHRHLGLALMYVRRFEDAEKSYDKTLELDPMDAGTHRDLGIVLSQLKRTSEAEAAFRRAVELNPSSASIRNDLGMFLGELQRFEEAVEQYREAIRLDPQFEFAYNNLGTVLRPLRRFPEAEAAFRKAIDLSPTLLMAHDNLARLLFQQERFGEMEAPARQAIELEPANINRRLAFADVLKGLGRFQDALALEEEAARIEPNNAAILNALGWTQIINHEWREAVKSLRKCIDLDHEGQYRLNSMENLGFALIHLGDLSAAETTLSNLLKLGPNEVGPSAVWAFLLAHKGVNLDEALERAKRGAAQSDGYPEYWQILGFVHFMRGEHEEAIKALKKAAEGYGRAYLAADTLVTLGQVYEAKRDIPAAIEAYRQAAAIEKGNKEAAGALKRLGG